MKAFNVEEVTLGNQRLLELASYIEEHDKIEKAAGRPGYNQHIIDHNASSPGDICGSPGCLLGFHYNDRLGVDRAVSVGDYYSLTGDEWDALFDPNGCDDAGGDVAKAVAFVRNFAESRNDGT